MDGKNRFDSHWTYSLIRLEYLVALIVCIGLALMQIDQIRWLPFIGLFAYIDLIGYIPGAIAYRRNAGRISPVYYVLYNTMHSAAVAALIAGVWCLVVQPEWALLAIPIHLCGDRSLFGNFLKPFSVPFEPQTTPAFSLFEKENGKAPQQYLCGRDEPVAVAARPR